MKRHPRCRLNHPSRPAPNGDPRLVLNGSGKAKNCRPVICLSCIIRKRGELAGNGTGCRPEWIIAGLAMLNPVLTGGGTASRESSGQGRSGDCNDAPYLQLKPLLFARKWRCQIMHILQGGRHYLQLPACLCLYIRHCFSCDSVGNLRPGSG